MHLNNKEMSKFIFSILSGSLALTFFITVCMAQPPVPQPIVDTGQIQCYGPYGIISCPIQGESFYGQDAQYESSPPDYRDNGDGTVTDFVTGLLWSKSVNKTKVSLCEAQKTADKMTLGGYTDWRLPNIKELYSLINFSGNTGSAGSGNPLNAIPFINTDYFDFRFGNVHAGERYIDAQWLSSTRYVSTTMNGSMTLFGVNFADGRIKGYGYQKKNRHHTQKKFFARYVRGNSYGQNIFKNNGNGTITDQATGLMWMKTDSGRGMNWEQALAFAENMKYAGYDDWRLPNAKELQYIVDYTRSPDTTDSPAIDPVFQTSAIFNESGQKDYPYFWTSTTHLEGRRPGIQGVYISFGRAMGKIRGRIMDVHGAGAQRSDPKIGRGGISRGPQGDYIRVYNYVRLVRGGGVIQNTSLPSANKNTYPYFIKTIDDTSETIYISETADKDKNDMNQDLAGHPDEQRHRSPLGGEGFINRLDSDGDGQISSSEFDGPPQHFRHFDQDGDGYISEEEAPTGPLPGRKPHRP